VLLDFVTVFFLVAGCAVLWLNLRRRRIVITKTDDAHQSVPTRHIPDDVEIRALLAALDPRASEAQADPEAEGDNAYANRVAGGIAKVKKTVGLNTHRRAESASPPPPWDRRHLRSGFGDGFGEVGNRLAQRVQPPPVRRLNWIIEARCQPCAAMHFIALARCRGL